MKQSHHEVFFHVAGEEKIWIGLREPNPLADRWVDKKWAQPKMLECKAKTSDNPTYHYAGLVVNPFLVPEAFKPQSLSRAEETWSKKFVNRCDFLPPLFDYYGATRKNPFGESFKLGVLTYKGKPIFADYDIMTICQSNAKGEFLMTGLEIMGKNFESRNFNRIMDKLNSGFGKEMVQHGAEFMWEGIGAKETEWIYWYGPGRRFLKGTSSFPQKDKHGNDYKYKGN